MNKKTKTKRQRFVILIAASQVERLKLVAAARRIKTGKYVSVSTLIAKAASKAYRKG
jgi:hypothetical protein